LGAGICFGIKESFQVRETFGCRARSEVREIFVGQGRREMGNEESCSAVFAKGFGGWEDRFQSVGSGVEYCGFGFKIQGLEFGRVELGEEDEPLSVAEANGAPPAHRP
jgi:hypothetical protein